tara:strand:- start:2864 stop:3601 length:738 start_codon:yes stop_codon:yes gene_type:complete
MISIRIILIYLLILNFIFSFEKKATYYIRKTNEQFNLVNDYQVDMIIKLEIPAFRMPKKEYKVYYKRPNKIRVKANGFGILPKTGLFTSPNDNFDNLKNIKLENSNNTQNIHNIMIKGDLIVDSLKLEMPNEYSRITFNPIVEVEIDTLHWVITNVTTRLDTLKLFQINNYYQTYDSIYYMPYQSIVKYYVKDKKLFNWLNNDVGSIIGQEESLISTQNSIVEGKITVNYKKYNINKGINNKIFE